MYPVSDAFLRAVQENTRNYRWTGQITTKGGAVWTGAGVQDAAALVVAVGVNDFDVLCLHKVSSLGFYFPLPPPVFRAGGALGSVINHSEAVK